MYEIIIYSLETRKKNIATRHKVGEIRAVGTRWKPQNFLCGSWEMRVAITIQGIQWRQ